MGFLTEYIHRYISCSPQILFFIFFNCGHIPSLQTFLGAKTFPPVFIMLFWRLISIGIHIFFLAKLMRQYCIANTDGLRMLPTHIDPRYKYSLRLRWNHNFQSHFWSILTYICPLMYVHQCLLFFFLLCKKMRNRSGVSLIHWFLKVHIDNLFIGNSYTMKLITCLTTC